MKKRTVKYSKQTERKREVSNVRMSTRKTMREVLQLRLRSGKRNTKRGMSEGYRWYYVSLRRRVHTIS